MTRPPDEPGILRFTGTERWVHHATAVLMITCLVTAAFLYIPELTTLAGRRETFVVIHVTAGVLLPVPFLAGWVSRAFRADVRLLNRFTPADWTWLRSRERRATVGGRGVVEIGKFNPGQKLNAAFVGGSILVMLVTGVLMLSGHRPVPRFGSDALRTGATFVHDWLSVAVFVMFLGHLYYAVSDPGSLRGMLTGRVDASWAARHHPAWLDDQDRDGKPGVHA